MRLLPARPAGLAGLLSRRLQRGALAALLSQKSGLAISVLLVVLVVLGGLAPIIAPYSPTAIAPTQRLLSPSAEHLMGTDFFGRDSLSRVLFGLQTSVLLALSSICLAAVLGGLLGLVSGYVMGTFDLVVQRLVDTLMAFPLLILAMVIVATVGPSGPGVVVAVGMVLAPRVSRVTRSAALALREQLFVEAARAIGSSGRRILLRHILPNAIDPLLVILGTSVGTAILAESTLGYLGLGTQEPQVSLGSLLGGRSRIYWQSAPWLAFFPGAVLAMLVFCFNMVGDALRDALDPRLRQQGASRVRYR